VNSDTTAHEARPTRQTVLLVDHEVLVRLVIDDYLRECGYRVIEADRAEEALLVLQQPDIRVDVLLSDVELPGQMDGFGLAKWTRENRRDVAVLLAGSTTRAADAAGELCDEGPLLRRPYEPQVVVDRIKRLLASGRRRASGGTADAASPVHPAP
jgi:CheY-like chemotaxis protein